MKTRALAAAALVASAASATAGGIDRSSQFLGPLFEKGGESGSYLQFSAGRVNPSAKGTGTGVSISNPLIDYNAIGLAYKTDFTEKLSFALIIEEPYGADIRYGTGGPFGGGGASVSSEQVTALLRYKFDERISIIGGIRALQVDGFIDTGVANPGITFPVIGTPPVLPVSVEADGDWSFSGVIGVAYEIPDIALRVALSYNSSNSVDFSGSESLLPGTPFASSGDTDFTVDFPESINLEFQTGIAKDTLLFGSIRHAMYDGFNLTTPTNPAVAGGALGSTTYVNFTSDSTTYSLGVGRRFNEQWSGSISIGYESAGTVPSTTPLAPTTGFRSVSVGAQYTADAFTISGGISYIVPGDQTVNSSAGPIEFDDNDAIAIGLRIGYNF